MVVRQPNLFLSLNLPFKFGARPIKLNSKKGQLKIQQMAFMLVAVFFLFILAGLFFLSISLYNLKKTAVNLEEQNSMLLASKLANSPEFSCGNSFGGSRLNCIDFDKLIVLQDLKNQYADLWGVAKIEVRKIFPADNSICSDENYPNCGVINILDKKVNTLPAASNFVSLCRKEANERMIYDKCELALLLISSEDKT